jgi:hypothetical protein
MVLFFAINTHKYKNKEFLMPIQSPAVHQNTGFAFDSSNFSMNFTSSGTLLPPHDSVSMEDWETEENEDDKKRLSTPVTDPDLEDDDDEVDETPTGEGDDISEDDDDFEQYLFGEGDD